MVVAAIFIEYDPIYTPMPSILVVQLPESTPGTPSIHFDVDDGLKGRSMDSLPYQRLV